MNKLVLLLLVSVCFCLPTQAAVEWLGGSGDWEDAAQWNTGQVPGPGDDVILTTGKISLNSAVTVRSVDVQNSVTFTVGNYARLTILPVATTSYPFIVYGKMIIYGIVQVLDQLSPWTGSSLMQVYGIVQTEGGGEVDLSGGGLAVFSNGRYNNRGNLEVQDMISYALTLQGILNNRGTITIIGDETNAGIYIQFPGQLVNHSNIILDDLQTGIVNENRIYNTRNIFLTNANTGIINSDLLDNRYAGVLKVEQVNSGHAIVNYENGNIQNRGRMEVANSTGVNGLRNFGDVTNYSSGKIYLRGAHYYEVLKNDVDGNFSNYGRINIYPTASNLQGGFKNSGDFVNYSSGYITISGNYTKAFNNLINFTNKGFLSVSNAQQLAVSNEGILTNSDCGEMNIRKRFENHSTGVWLNDSWLRLISSDTPVNNGFFQNTAVIEDLGNTLASVAINNDGVIAHPPASLVYVGSNANILDIGSLSQIGMPNYFYDEPGGNALGTYNASNNTLDVYPSALGLKAFYFEAELLGYNCTAWFVVELPDAIQPSPSPFTGTPTSFSTNTAVAATSVYPNPSNGLVAVNWPAATQEQAVRWSVVNLQGQEIASGTSAQNKIDLTAFPKATYLLRQQNDTDGWKIVDRIIVQ